MSFVPESDSVFEIVIFSSSHHPAERLSHTQHSKLFIGRAGILLRLLDLSLSDFLYSLERVTYLMR